MNTVDYGVALMGRVGGDGKDSEREKPRGQKDRKTGHNKKHHHHKHKHKKPPHARVPKHNPPSKQETSGTPSNPDLRSSGEKRTEGQLSQMSAPSPWPDTDDMQGRWSKDTKVNEKDIIDEKEGQGILRNKAPASVCAKNVSVSTKEEKEPDKLEKDSVAVSTSTKIYESRLAEPSSTKESPPDHTASIFGSGGESAMYQGDAPRGVAHDNDCPGAFAVPGFDDSVMEYTPTVDLESPPMPMELEPISAEKVDEEADNRVFNERLQKELKRKLAEKEKNTAVAEVVDIRLCLCSPRVRHMGIVGALIVVVAVALAIALLLTLRPEPGLVDFLSPYSFDGGVALKTPSSPQNNAMNWLAHNAMIAKYTNAKKIQRYALATLYYSTNGDGWKDRTGWLSDDDECIGWYNKGVSDRTACTSEGSLMQLNLRSNSLKGTLPEEIALLSDSLGMYLGQSLIP